MIAGPNFSESSRSPTYFDTESTRDPGFSMRETWQVADSFGTASSPLVASVNYDLAANAKYWSFFIPADVSVEEYVTAVLNSQKLASCEHVDEAFATVEYKSGTHWERYLATTAVFTKRVFLYVDANLSSDDRKAIAARMAGAGLDALVRDREYAMQRSKSTKPLVFISHDSRDKDTLVRELAFEINRLMCPVWYDEYSLRVGDSLRASIEKGLKETRNCIVILSPNFLSNEGWGRAEFDAVFTRELMEKTNVILPVWHGVTKEAVYQYSPRLADKVGLSTSLGIKELARRLVNAVRPSAG